MSPSCDKLAAQDRRVRWPIFRRFDLSPALMLASLAFAVYFLWAGGRKAEALVEANAKVRSALDDTLPKVGDTLAPRLTAKNGAGQSVDLIDRSRSSLWVVFSVHCQPCMNERPSWNNLRVRILSSGGAIRFISIDKAAEIAAFSRDNPDLPVANAPQEVIRALRLTIAPYYLLIGPDARVKWSNRGLLSRSAAASLYKELTSAALSH
jgi:AhpC/TSA family